MVTEEVNEKVKNQRADLYENEEKVLTQEQSVRESYNDQNSIFEIPDSKWVSAR